MRYSWVYKFEENESLTLHAMSLELIETEETGVVVEEGKERGNVKQEGVPEDGAVVLDVHRRWYEV